MADSVRERRLKYDRPSAPSHTTARSAALLEIVCRRFTKILLMHGVRQRRAKRSWQSGPVNIVDE
ncbi:hypothetical protein QTP88_026843 [Uroleucon formosanum]